MTALLLIDVQQGFKDLAHWGGARNNQLAEHNCKTLLDTYRSKGLPVYHIQHCSTNPNSPLHEDNPGNSLHELVTPQGREPVIKKSVNSAFIGTQLDQKLASEGINHVVIAGLTTDHCVSTSVRMAANLGFKTTLIEDATATFDKIGLDGTKYPAQLMHDTVIASLKDEFANIETTQSWLEKL